LEGVDQIAAVQGGMGGNASRPAGLDSTLTERESEDAVQKGIKGTLPFSSLKR